MFNGHIVLHYKNTTIVYMNEEQFCEFCIAPVPYISE